MNQSEYVKDIFNPNRVKAYFDADPINLIDDFVNKIKSNSSIV